MPIPQFLGGARVYGGSGQQFPERDKILLIICILHSLFCQPKFRLQSTILNLIPNYFLSREQIIQISHTPKWAEHREESVHPGEDHHQLGHSPTDGQREQDWKADLVGDESDAGQEDDEADIEAGILEDCKETLCGDHNIANTMQRSDIVGKGLSSINTCNIDADEEI